jgi:hypothetical protein
VGFLFSLSYIAAAVPTEKKNKKFHKSSNSEVILEKKK